MSFVNKLSITMSIYYAITIGNVYYVTGGRPYELNIEGIEQTELSRVTSEWRDIIS